MHIYDSTGGSTGGGGACTSIGLAVWTVIGDDASPPSACCEVVPPQLPTPTILSIVLESSMGFKQELLISAA